MYSHSVLHRVLPFAAILLVSAPRAVSAQGAGAGDGSPFSVLLLSTGGTRMTVDAINARLIPAGFAGLSNDGITYGATGYVAIGRSLLGAEVGQTTFGEEGLNNGRTDDLNSRFALATAGYALYASGRLSLISQVGVGAGRVDVTLRQRAGTATSTAQPTFDEVAQAPGPESTLSGRHLLFSVAGGADYLVVPTAASAWGVVLGLRAGLLVAPNRTTWSRGGAEVGAGPDGGPGGPFVRLVVGVGRR